MKGAGDKRMESTKGLPCAQQTKTSVSSLPHEKGQVTKVCGAR